MSVYECGYSPYKAVCVCVHANKCAIARHMKLINMQAQPRQKKSELGMGWHPKPVQLFILHLSKSES